MFAGSVICCAVALSAVDGRLCAKESLAMAPEPNASARIVRFGTFEADLNARELRKGGVKIKVHGQPFEVLTLLLARPGEVVPREELRQRLWSTETFVDFDHGVNTAINRLREALGDSAENPRFIETVPRRGYRCIAAVNGNVVAAPGIDDRPDAAKTRWPHLDFRITMALSLGVAVLLLAVLGFGLKDLWQRLSAKNTVPPIGSIAVLPLQNLSSDPAQEYFSDGMTDALITDLAQIGSLKVISRTSTLQYKQTK